jgi:hypothetical protein
MLQICHQQMARDTLMMRRAVVVGFLLVFGLAVRGSSVYRYEVDRGSDLEKELGYELSVHEEHGEKQTESVDKVIPVEGAAPNYTVKFHVPVADKLKDVFELALTVNDGNAILAQVPLAISSRFTKENEVDVQFLVRKDWIDQAVLDIRCAPWMTVHPETVYSIRLGDYLPGYAPTEAQRIAELRKRHPSIGSLASHRANKAPDYSNNLGALTVAQNLFSEVNFIGLSRAGLETLLGAPDAKPLSPQNSVTYTFGNGGQAVICRFHFDAKGNVESVEKIPRQ